jgi:tetratricopeptide (TPR) repeat protein
MTVRLRVLILAIVCLGLSAFVLAQSNDDEGPMTRVPVDKSAPPPKDNRKSPPRSDTLGPDESSSKQTQIDVSPPSGDAKKTDNASDSDVSEFHPWDPHKAAKCVEVGDYYYKQGNYRAAISRYQEALEWKPRDAEATYKLGEAQEKSGDLGGALGNYQAYLKILPKGPWAAKAQQGVDRLKSKSGATSAQATPNPS